MFNRNAQSRSSPSVAATGPARGTAAKTAPVAPRNPVSPPVTTASPSSFRAAAATSPLNRSPRRSGVLPAATSVPKAPMMVPAPMFGSPTLTSRSGSPTMRFPDQVRPGSPTLRFPDQVRPGSPTLQSRTGVTEPPIVKQPVPQPSPTLSSSSPSMAGRYPSPTAGRSGVGTAALSAVEIANAVSRAVGAVDKMAPEGRQARVSQAPQSPRFTFGQQAVASEPPSLTGSFSKQQVVAAVPAPAPQSPGRQAAYPVPATSLPVRQAAGSESARQKIRQILAEWYEPDGASNKCQNAFVRVDVKRSGQLSWNEDVARVYVCAVFEDLGVPRPQFMAMKTADLVQIFNKNDTHRDHMLHEQESVEFARLCFEQALRELGDQDPIMPAEKKAKVSETRDLGDQIRSAKVAMAAVASVPAHETPAQRLRHILEHWSEPLGARERCHHSFRRVDADFNGVLSWNDDEARLFVCTMFDELGVQRPAFMAMKTRELLNLFNGSDNHIQDFQLDEQEATEFGRACLEKALREHGDQDVIEPPKPKTRNIGDDEFKPAKVAVAAVASVPPHETPAQRIRHILEDWLQPHGAKSNVYHAMCRVDENHDGQLSWNDDEARLFACTLFDELGVPRPQFMAMKTAELLNIFNGMDVRRDFVLDEGEAVEFAKGCLEKALRELGDQAPVNVKPVRTRSLDDELGDHAQQLQAAEKDRDKANTELKRVVNCLISVLQDNGQTSITNDSTGDDVIGHLSQMMPRLLQDLQAARQDVGEYQEMLQKYQNDGNTKLSDLSDAMARLSEERDNLALELEHCVTDKDTIQKELEHIKAQVSVSQDESQLQMQLQEKQLQQLSAEKEQAQADLNEMEQELVKLDAEDKVKIAELTNALSQTSIEIDDLKAELGSAKSLHSTTLDAMTKLDMQFSESNERQLDVSKELALAKSQRDEYEREASQSKMQLQQTTTEMHEQLQHLSVEKEQALADLREALEKDNLAQLQQTTAEMHEQLQHLSVEKEQALADLREVQDKDKQELVNHIAEDNVKIAELTNALSQTSIVIEDLKAQDNVKIAELTNALSQTSVEIEDLKAQDNVKIAELTNALSQTSIVIDDLKAELGNAKSLHQKTLEAFDARFADLSAELVQAKSQRDAYEHEASKSKQQVHASESAFNAKVGELSHALARAEAGRTEAENRSARGAGYHSKLEEEHEELKVKFARLEGKLKVAAQDVEELNASAAASAAKRTREECAVEHSAQLAQLAHKIKDLEKQNKALQGGDGDGHGDSMWACFTPRSAASGPASKQDMPPPLDPKSPKDTPYNTDDEGPHPEKKKEDSNAFLSGLFH